MYLSTVNSNNTFKALLAEVGVFLDTYYEYRCRPEYKGFFGRIRAYLDRQEDEEKRKKYEELEAVDFAFGSDPNSGLRQKLALMAKREDTFSTALLKLITEKGQDPVEIYKRANIDRKLFSKIRSQEDYRPSKNTVISLAVALELSLDETQLLLRRAGYALSRSIMSDVIIEFFITEEKYDIFEINQVLFAYKLPPLF